MQNYDGQFKLNGQEYFYRAKDDSESSKITRVNNEEHHYRMVEITNKETGNYDVMMISTGDSFTMFHMANYRLLLSLLLQSHIREVSCTPPEAPVLLLYESHHLHRPRQEESCLLHSQLPAHLLLLLYLPLKS